MATLEKIVHAIALRTSQIAQIALAAVMIVIVANIIMRLWWKPLTGSYEMVEILGAVLLSMGAAHCAVTKGHVAVGVLVEKLSLRMQAFFDVVVNIISLFFTGAVSWGLITYAGMVYGRGLETSSLGIPLYPFYYLVTFGLIILSLVIMVELLKSAIIVVKGVEEK